jgi:hypothetical protein
VAQARSRTAIFAFVAARLADIPRAEFAEFCRNELGVGLGAAALHAAGKRRRHPAPRKAPRGPKPRPGDEPAEASPPTEDRAFRDWLMVEEHKLGLDTALVRLEGDERPPTELLENLARIPGVRQVIDLAQRRDVLIVVIFNGRHDRQRLRGQLEELDRNMLWEDIEHESWWPAMDTWKSLAQRAAEEEMLSVGRG